MTSNDNQHDQLGESRSEELNVPHPSHEDERQGKKPADATSGDEVLDIPNPDEDYLLTAYLFGDISQAGRAEVDRRLEVSEATRAAMEKLRSTKLLIEDALKGSCDDEESTTGRRVDSTELAALLRERQRARRMKMAISWFSIAATVMICSAFVLSSFKARSGMEMVDVARSAPDLAMESAADAVPGRSSTTFASGEPPRAPAPGSTEGASEWRYSGARGAKESRGRPGGPRGGRAKSKEALEYKPTLRRDIARRAKKLNERASDMGSEADSFSNAPVTTLAESEPVDSPQILDQLAKAPDDSEALIRRNARRRGTRPQAKNEGESLPPAPSKKPQMGFYTWRLQSQNRQQVQPQAESIEQQSIEDPSAVREVVEPSLHEQWAEEAEEAVPERPRPLVAGGAAARDQRRFQQSAGAKLDATEARRKDVLPARQRLESPSEPDTFEVQGRLRSVNGVGQLSDGEVLLGAKTKSELEGAEISDRRSSELKRELRELLAEGRASDYGLAGRHRSSVRAAGKQAGPEEIPAPSDERFDDSVDRDLAKQVDRAQAQSRAYGQSLDEANVVAPQSDKTAPLGTDPYSKLQKVIESYARQAPGRTAGADRSGGGQILPQRAGEIADLVNREQTRLFSMVPGGAGTASPTDRSGWLARLDASYHNAQREIAPLEKELRAYMYYKSLDRELTLETYSAQPLDVPPPAIGDENLGRDGFRERYEVNPFVDTRHDHLSTFSMDVDTASFTRARERIQSGVLPDPTSVRVEEFVNYFPQDCAPDPDAAFSVCTEGGPAPFGAGLDLVKITVKARELRPNERKSAVLTFAIDTSGSMHMQNSLDLMRGAMKALVESLRADDQVAVVAYNANAYVALPHTPARETERIFSALDSLKASGGTNVEGGLDLAYRLADEVRRPKAINRVILCSDGVANVGARSPEDVLQKVKVFAGRGIYLSVVGFGTRRYNDSFLERVANEGNGNYSYVANLSDARAVFQKNLPATLQVLAEDAKIQLDFNPEVVTHYRLLGYENRDIADKDFRNDKIDAAEVGPGTTVTVLYELRRSQGSHGDLGRLFIRYRDTGTRKIDELNFSLPPGVLQTQPENTSAEFRFTACAAETAELLRDSYWARDGSFGNVLEKLYGLDADFRARPEWSELARLVTEAQRLFVLRVAGQAGR